MELLTAAMRLRNPFLKSSVDRTAAAGAGSTPGEGVFGARFRTLGRVARPVLAIAAAALLASCQEALLGPDHDESPRADLELLWRTFDRHYALFDVKKVDWDSVGDAARSRVGATTTRSELWQIIADMLHALDDPHVFLTDGTRIINSGVLLGRRMDDFSSVVVEAYLVGGGTGGGGRVRYAMFDGHRIAYVRVADFHGDGLWPAGLDGLLASHPGLDGIMLDLRGNPGGTTEAYQAVASALVDRPVEYLRWTARTGPRHEDFEEPWPLQVRPRSGGPAWMGPLAVLTNRHTGSSSDHLNWLLRRYRPLTVQVGDTTSGTFGTVFAYQVLPTGWVYSFTGRQALSMEGVALDSLRGIAPQVHVENSPADLASGRDRVVEEAIRRLEAMADSQGRAGIGEP